MAISPENAAEILARCARHCCICRRFRPTQLQVHHIIEQHEDGTDDIDNLIAVCVSCHSDVHTNTKLTRRFTVRELKLHRDSVCQLVAEGKLPASLGGTEDLVSLAAAVIQALQSGGGLQPDDESKLPIESIDILLSAVSHKSSVVIDRSGDQMLLKAGKAHFIQSRKLPTSALYPDSIVKLVSAKLLEGNQDELYVTQAGYAFADDLLSANPSYTMVKAKCLGCGLHFVVCTWDLERHSSSSLYCPECGQHRGAFIVWYQRMCGFIFQTVPGLGQLVAREAKELKHK